MENPRYKRTPDGQESRRKPKTPAIKTITSVTAIRSNSTFLQDNSSAFKKMNKILICLVLATVLMCSSARPQYGYHPGFGGGNGAGFGTGQAGFGGASASGVGISSAYNGGFGSGSGSGSAFNGGLFGGQYATGSGQGISFGK